MSDATQHCFFCDKLRYFVGLKTDLRYGAIFIFGTNGVGRAFKTKSKVLSIHTTTKKYFITYKLFSDSDLPALLEQTLKLHNMLTYIHQG